MKNYSLKNMWFIKFLTFILIACLCFQAIGLDGFAISSARNNVSISNGVAYLHKIQNKDGGFPSAPGEKSSPAITAWVVMALSAAGENAKDSKWAPTGEGPDSYLKNTPLKFEGLNDYSRYTLALTAMGEKPLLNGVNLADKIQKAQQKNGEFGFSEECQDQMINTHMWAIIALNSAGKEVKNRSAARKWLLSVQNSDGGFGWYKGGDSDPDDTGVAIQTLVLLGENPKKSHAIINALKYLKANQNKDGGYGAPESNSASDAWVLQGLIAGKSNEGTPIEHLKTLQQKDGSFLWRKDSNSSAVMMTAYSICAISGHSYPVKKLKKV